MSPPIESASPIHFVKDVGAALAWYRDRLGLPVAFTWPNAEEPAYAGLVAGRNFLHLCGPREWHPPNRTYSECYVFVAGGRGPLDALAEEIRSRGVALEQEPMEFGYGMREFCVRDPDGNRLTFGASTETG